MNALSFPGPIGAFLPWPFRHFLPGAMAGPDSCTASNGGSTLTCEGNQSQGISITTPPSQLEVRQLNQDIAPASDTTGIRMISNGTGNVLINSGTHSSVVEIKTSGNAAYGIEGITLGTPSLSAPPDAFLGVPLVGVDPNVSGGTVTINSFSNIVTDGANAHAIRAYSASPGYPESVLSQLRSFSDTGFSFAVSSVRNTAGDVLNFTGASIEVRGHLMDANGTILRDGNGNAIEHGTFTFYPDGHFTVQYSAAELAAQAALAAGQTLSTAVSYSVLAHGPAIRRQITANWSSPSKRTATATWCKTGKPGSTLSASAANRQRPVHPPCSPTCNAMSQAFSAMRRLAVQVTASRSPAMARSRRKRVGPVGSTPTARAAPAPGGAMAASGIRLVAAAWAVTVARSMLRPAAASSRIWMLPAASSPSVLAAKVGPAAMGGHWRHGQKGGTGGTGGSVTVSGNADITTSGADATGIYALSVGGNGGGGGSGSGAMPGGGGGFGGKGGEVSVVGGWNVTTGGDYAKGIWARSVGGNAGAGGSGGWLFGKPGSGGDASDGGKVTLQSAGTIDTSGKYAYGLYAQSVGGFGGPGGTSWDCSGPSAATPTAAAAAVTWMSGTKRRAPSEPTTCTATGFSRRALAAAAAAAVAASPCWPALAARAPPAAMAAW